MKMGILNKKCNIIRCEAEQKMCRCKDRVKDKQKNDRDANIYKPIKNFTTISEEN